MNTKLNKLTTFLSCFCGRYEYREMVILLKSINEGNDSVANLEKLKSCLEKFQCTSTLELEQRKEALSQISLILSELQNNPEHVQPRETPANDAGTKDTGNTEAPDAQGVTDNSKVNEPEPIVEQPATEQAVEQPTETESEVSTDTPEVSTEATPVEPEPAPVEAPAKPARKSAKK